MDLETPTVFDDRLSPVPLRNRSLSYVRRLRTFTETHIAERRRNLLALPIDSPDRLPLTKSINRVKGRLQKIRRAYQEILLQDTAEQVTEDGSVPTRRVVIPATVKSLPLLPLNQETELQALFAKLTQTAERGYATRAAIANNPD